ncbi:Ppx/GppA phosphatase family protein [Ornithinicoccus halotolerans]|uniref:Ppx/GppA phosphatase family protein n=1 Tax=Ornithinicoccus halotolerans TaxID=1748220 RepID=UPI001297EE8A|nr:exopolyphosphatase [Ornithinicoccus halotolerans]
MTRVGAVDCGTNSIRLLVADLVPGPGDVPVLREVTREMEVVRLGQGVDATGHLDDQALGRTLAVAERYAETCRDAGCEAVRFVATSATRDADNADEFVAGVGRAFAEFRALPEVISGDEEARLSFVGATAPLRAEGSAPGPYLVADIGGGSTELVRGQAEADEAVSLAIGSVRLTERHLQHVDPPGEEEVWPALGDITAALDRAAEEVALQEVGCLIGVAGSITTVTAHALGLDSYRRDRIHGAELPVEDVVHACTDLVRMTRERRAALPYMHPGRVDVIGAGALIWRSIVQRVAHDADLRTVRASESDILDGIALSLAR